MSRVEPQAGDIIDVWFSCGAASAVALQQTLLRYGNLCQVRALNNPIAEEHAATKSENRAARQLRADRRMELEIMSVHMTDEQREAAKARAIRRAS